MNFERLRWLRLKCSRLLRRGRQEAALDAELQFHFDQLVAEFRATGLSDREARLAAQREFGPADAYREETRDTWRPPALADLGRSVRFAVRSLARSPVFSIIAIVTLALGIGANTAMFSVLNSILLKPLPYPQSSDVDRIDRVTSQDREGRIAPADFRDFRRAAGAYGEIAAYAVGSTSLSEAGQPAEFAREARATANLFALLRVQTQLGRDFRPQEETVGHHRVVVLSHRSWQNRFGGRADVIGHLVRIDGEPHEVIGVLPLSFNDWRHLGNIDLFRPLALDAPAASDRHGATLRVLGRRDSTLSRADSDAFIADFGARLAAEFPEVHAGSAWRAVPLDDSVVDDSGRAIMPMLVGLSGFVLLIACSNLANLLLARTIARTREFAVRAALGASRSQLVRPLLLESLLLALAGGACAVVVAIWATDYLSVRSTGNNGDRVIFTLDWSVLGWAFGASLVTALAVGLAPALFAMRLDLNATLKSGGRGATGGRGHQQLRQALIVGQFALAMVLLAGAALFIRGLDELTHRRAGWSSENLITGNILLPAAAYPDAGYITAFHRLAVERLETLPGVAAVSLAAVAPFFSWSDVQKFVVEGQLPPEPGREPGAMVNGVASRYFETVGTRVIAGRAFDERDTASSSKVVILSQSMANGLFGHENPLGRRLVRLGGVHPESLEIVGIAVDVKSVEAEPGPVQYQLYQPLAQQPRPQVEILVRTTGVAAAPMIESIRNAITALDGDLPVRRLQAADATIYRANYQLRVLRDILGAIATLGLGLAALGIYGVIARVTAQRTSEFAIRLALGAGLRDISRLVLGSGVRLALLGSALGLFGALGVSKIIGAGFPGMRFESPPVLIGTTLLLVIVAVSACWLPARRASRVNPIEALRAE